MVVKKDYIQNVPDFIKRTLKNLEIYLEAVKDGHDKEKYEVTQIINSLLGLLVFPKEILLSKNQKKRKQLSLFPNDDVRTAYERRTSNRTTNPEGDDFFAMYRCMRNAISHGDIIVYGTGGDIDGVGTIESLEFADKDVMGSHEKVSFVLTIDDIFNIVAHIAMSIDPTIPQKIFEDIAEKVPVTFKRCPIPAQDEP